MPSTVLIGGPPCGSAGHALSEPAARALYCGRREQADFDASRRAGAPRGIRRAGVLGHRAVRVAGPRPDVRHPRRGRRQGGRRHRGHRRAPDVGSSEHDDGVAARRPDAGPGAGLVDVRARAAGSPRAGLSAGQVQGRDRRGQHHRLPPVRGQRRVRGAALPEVPDVDHSGERQRPGSVGGQVAAGRRNRRRQRQAGQQVGRVHGAAEGHQARRHTS